MTLRNLCYVVLLVASYSNGQVQYQDREQTSTEQARASKGISADYVLKTLEISPPAQEADEDHLPEQLEELEFLLPPAQYLNICQALFMQPEIRDIGYAIEELKQAAALLKADLVESEPDRSILDGVNDNTALEDLPLPEQEPHETWHLGNMLLAGSATYMLASLLATGLSQPWLLPNDTAAMQLEHLAAQAGSQSAHLALMDRYLTGRGVPRSCPEAFRRGWQVAEALVVDLDAQGGEEPIQAAPYLRQRWRDASYTPTVPGSNTQSLTDLTLARGPGLESDGLMGLWGNTWGLVDAAQLEADPANAVEVLRAAAMDGDPHALSTLGHMHMRGVHLPRNATRARVLLVSAAELGSSSAYNALGVMHLQGLGTPVNYTRSKQMFDIGASMGEPDCFYNLAVLYIGGQGVEADDDVALHYLQDAHDYGHWRAPYQMALLLQEGTTSTKPNCTAAVQHMYTFLTERAPWAVDIQTAVDDLDSGDAWAALVQMAMTAEQGSPAAEANLAWMLTRGLGYNNSDRHERALEMHLRAGKQAFMPGELVDAGLLLFDRGHTLRSGGNRSEALQLWRKAAGQQDTEARYLLGWAAESGALGPRNLSLARDMYLEAVRESLHESEALAPFLALAKVRLMIFLVAMAGPAQWEMSILTLLCCCLTTVLWWRRRRRTRLPAASPGA